MVVIKRIAPLSAAKIAGLIYALIGLAVALLVWIVSLVGLDYSGMRNSPFLPFSPNYVVEGGAIGVVLLPLFNGVFCFVITLIGAWVYNLAAHLVGGVEIDVQPDTPPEVAG